MRHLRGMPLVLAILAVCAVPFVAAFDAMRRARDSFMDGLAAMFAPEPYLFAADLQDQPRDENGMMLPRYMQQSLRHEAGVPRYGAARNI